MKIIKKKVSVNGDYIVPLLDNFIFQTREVKDGKFDLGGFILSSECKLIFQNSIGFNEWGFKLIDNLLFGFDSNEKIIKVINYHKWELVEYFSFLENFLPLQIIDENLIVLANKESNYADYCIYNFRNKTVVREFIACRLSLVVKEFEQYIVTIDNVLRSIIICINIEKGEKIWEINLNELVHSEEKFQNYMDYFRLKNDPDNTVKQFEIFENIIVVRTYNFLIGIDLPTGRIIWLSPEEKDLGVTYVGMLQFSINSEGVIYSVGNVTDYKLRTYEAKTGNLIWKSPVNWLQLSGLTSSTFSEFIMNEKYIFLTNINSGQIVVIEKQRGLVVDVTNLYKKEKTIYGQVTKPIIVKDKLLILAARELFVFDISELGC